MDCVRSSPNPLKDAVIRHRVSIHRLKEVAPGPEIKSGYPISSGITSQGDGQ